MNNAVQKPKYRSIYTHNTHNIHSQYKNGMASFCMHKVHWIACLDTQAPEHHLLRITHPYIEFDEEKKNIEIIGAGAAAAAAAVSADAVT